jgi:hypothetical protein
VVQVFLPWIGGPIQPDPERVRLAKSVSPGNILEASTFTDGEECPWHRHTLNLPPPDDHSTFVMSINHKFADAGTLTALFYERSSVCSHLRNSGVQDPLLEFLYESYINFTEDRRTFTRMSVLAGETAPLDATSANTRSNVQRHETRRHPENEGLRQSKANMDPLSFHSLFLMSWITLVDRCHLNLLESVSVFVAVLSCPNTSEPICKVALELL